MTAGSLTSRVVPPVRLGSRSRHILERNLLVNRRAWTVLLSGFVEPIFYLFSIGIGIGELVGDLDATVYGTTSYAAYVAPALLASSAMNGAVFESTFNIFFKMRYAKTYDAMLSTPMGVSDIAVGEITWSLVRGGLYAIGFMAVMAVMGLITSPLALAAIPAAVLIGFSFGAAGMAATTFMRSWQDFDLVSLVTLPLFLFSATFYPLSVYPPALQTVARFSPLYHGVELIRGLTLSQPDITMIGHVAFLLALGTIGALVTSRRLGILLLK